MRENIFLQKNLGEREREILLGDGVEQLLNRLHSYKSPYYYVLLFGIIESSLHSQYWRILIPYSVCMEDLELFVCSCLHVVFLSSVMEDIM